MFSNYLDLLKTIYTKERLEATDDIGVCIALTKTLAKEQSNLEIIRKIIPFLFYIEPKRYFYLLYFSIPKKNYIPKSLKVEKAEEEENKLLDRVQSVLQWSNRERKFNTKILTKTILEDEKFWKGELGLK